MARDQSGRIQVITNPQALPASCAICGIAPGQSNSNAGGPVGGQEMEFADFGLQFEFYGAFYLCERCVFELADNFGCASPTLTNSLMEQVRYLNEQNAGLKNQLKELERALGDHVLAGLNITVDSNGNILSSDTVSATNS